MQPRNLPKLASMFLEQHGSRPLLLEVKACGMDYGRPGPSNTTSGVAVIDISGMLTAEERWWGSSYAEIRHEIQGALDSPECKAILLRIDSPGGSTDEAFETAAFVAEAASQKPVWAVADVNCYSAAYLLASQCNRIIAAPSSGGVGSIGIYAAHVDYSAMLDEAGMKVTLISAGKGKTDGNPYEPLSAEAKATFQAEVDRQYDLFVAAVASGRKMSEKAIREMGAALQHGKANAVGSGLADDAGTVEEALAALVAKVNTSSTSSASASAAASSPKGADMAEKLKAGAAAAADEGCDKPEDAKGKKKAADDGTDEDTTGAKGMAAAAEIADMCQMAGIPAKTGEMIGMAAKGKPMAEIRKAIINAKAEASGDEIRATAPVSGQSKQGKNPLLAAVDSLKGFYGAVARQEEGR